MRICLRRWARARSYAGQLMGFGLRSGAGGAGGVSLEVEGEEGRGITFVVVLVGFGILFSFG